MRPAKFWDKSLFSVQYITHLLFFAFLLFKD